MDHNVLVAACESRVYDLMTVTEAELLDIVVPLNFAVRACSHTHASSLAAEKQSGLGQLSWHCNRC